MRQRLATRTAQRYAPVPNTPALPTLDDIDVVGKRVLLRVDYNIPPTATGNIRDDYRVLETIPTLKRLMDAGARVGIITHRGRPGGRIVNELSTQPLAPVLSKLLGQSVEWVPDCVGRIADRAMSELAPGRIVLMENLRFLR